MGTKTEILSVLLACFTTVLHTLDSIPVVEVSGIEPLTSCMPCKRSPS